MRVTLVEPGSGPSTRLTASSGARTDGLIPEAYAPFAQSLLAGFAEGAAVTSAAGGAEVVWRAADGASERLRFAAGADAVALAGRA